jgi:hypothetical protein
MSAEIGEVKRPEGGGVFGDGDENSEGFFDFGKKTQGLFFGLLGAVPP